MVKRNRTQRVMTKGIDTDFYSNENKPGKKELPAILFTLPF
jgi:hypothetical protein